jgi:putative spermidine/putrescine transport system substrate-binding protein
MRRPRSRRFAFVCAVAGAALIAASCAGTTGTAPATTAGTSTLPSASPSASLGAASPSALGGKLVFSSFGGTFQAAQVKALAQPFADNFGVTLVLDEVSDVAKIKAAIEANSVPWDVVDVGFSDYAVLSKAGLLEPIDYSVFDPATISALDTKYRYADGIVADTSAVGIGYRTDLGLTSHPTSWADFWDTTKFPGPRGLYPGTFTTGPWEPALLADGVDPAHLYPIDFNRALKSLDKIKCAVKVWADKSATGIQAIVSGDVNYTYAGNGRIILAKTGGAKVDFDYGQALVDYDVFIVPKGAKNKANAMRFLAYAETPDPSAEFMKEIPYSMPNSDAIAKLDPALAKTLPTYPDNLAKLVRFDGDWWGQDSGHGNTNREYSLKLWNDWFAALHC